MFWSHKTNPYFLNKECFWMPSDSVPEGTLTTEQTILMQIYLYVFFITNTSPSTAIWRRQWHPTPVLLPGKSHGRRSLVGCSPWGCEESDMTERLHFHFSLWCIGEGNGNPLHCSCLKNPRDRGAWWAAVYGVAQSQTWLKWLSSSSSTAISSWLLDWINWYSYTHSQVEDYSYSSYFFFLTTCVSNFLDNIIKLISFLWKIFIIY